MLLPPPPEATARQAYEAGLVIMSVFDEWLRRWDLVTDGKPLATSSSILLPVRRNSVLAMVKIARVEEERRGAALMAWYAGDGAARVLECESSAVLLERIVGQKSLVMMSRTGHDDEATRVICETVARLHSPRQREAPTGLVPLTVWFRGLESAGRHAVLLESAATVARELLAEPEDVVVLHGDIHHGNILHDAQRGWLAIDPKGLRGERGFDYANTFCNPDIKTASACFVRRLEMIAGEARVNRGRLLKWVLAYAGLSAAWSLADGDDAEPALTIVKMASRELDTPTGQRPIGR